MTESEKQEILEAIKAESHDIVDLPVTSTLNGITSLPAMRGQELVVAPLNLLSRPAVDAASAANVAAQNANQAAINAQAATGRIEQLDDRVTSNEEILSGKLDAAWPEFVTIVTPRMLPGAVDYNVEIINDFPPEEGIPRGVAFIGAPFNLFAYRSAIIGKYYKHFVREDEYNTNEAGAIHCRVDRVFNYKPTITMSDIDCGAYRFDPNANVLRPISYRTPSSSMELIFHYDGGGLRKYQVAGLTEALADMTETEKLSRIEIGDSVVYDASNATPSIPSTPADEVPLTPVQLSMLQEMAIVHNKTFIVFRQAAGTTIDWGESITTQTPSDREQWFTIMRSSANIIGGNVTEIAAIASPYPLQTNCFFYTHDDLERLTLATGRKLPTAINNLLYLCKAREVNLAAYNTSQVTNAKYAFCGCTAERIDGLETLDLSQCENIEHIFEDCRSLYQTDGCLDLSGWHCQNLTTLRAVFYKLVLISNMVLSGWDTRRVEDYSQLWASCIAIKYIDLTGWDTRSAANLSQMFHSFNWSDSILEFITVSPSFFATRGVIDFASLAFNSSANYLGFTDSTRLRSNGWLEMIAATAPTIRLADDWDEEAWQADKLEENEATPRLLTEENGVWYLNDGVERIIQLTSHLKNASWAQPYISQLQQKGYTIA